MKYYAFLKNGLNVSPVYNKWCVYFAAQCLYVRTVFRRASSRQQFALRAPARERALADLIPSFQLFSDGRPSFGFSLSYDSSKKWAGLRLFQ